MEGRIANAPPDVPTELRDHPQYEVLRELGRGGMGIVYLAENRLMKRPEVLKVINQSLLGNSDAAERFLGEIRSAARLSHPNIVTAFSAFRAGQLVVLAMEYVPGDNLAQIVQSRGPLPVTNACYYAHQVAMGLQHAHEKGLVHRDIKPQNLILARAGKKHTVKILDFGLAKATRDGSQADRGLTGTGMMLGTPDYIAPEQTLDAAHADIRADIYSLGCALYCLLTGRPPFQGRSEFEVLQAHHTIEPTPLDRVRAEVPAELAAIAARMMAKDPGRRYQLPAEVVQALGAFIKGDLKSATPHPATAAERGSTPAPTQALEGTRVEGHDTIERARIAGAAREQAPAPAQSPTPQLPLPQATRIESSGTIERARLVAVPVTPEAAPLAQRAQSQSKQAAPVARRASPRAEDRSAAPLQPLKTKHWLIAGGALALVLFAGLVIVGGLIALWAFGVFSRAKKDTLAAREETSQPAVFENLPPTPPISASVSVALPPINTAGPRLEPRGVGEGFTRLFNGKDLNGWRHRPDLEHNPWSVHGETLLGQPTPLAKQGNLLTSKEYADFTLRFDFRLDQAILGVALRAFPGESLPGEPNRYPVHPTLILSSPSTGAPYTTGTIYRISDSGILTNENPLVLDANRWHFMELTVHADSCVAKVDDKLLLDLRLPEEPECSSCVPGLARLTGRVGFEVIAGTIHLGNIDIKELPRPEFQEVLAPIFNGLDLTGWHQVAGTAQVLLKEGELRASNRKRTPDYLLTNRSDYADFHFQCQVRVADANRNPPEILLRADPASKLPGGLRGYRVCFSGIEPNLRGKSRPATSFSLFGRDRLVWPLARAAPADLGFGAWVTLDLFAIGNRFRALANGETLVDVRDEGQALRRGAIALGLRGGAYDIRYRNISIRELTPQQGPLAADSRTRWVHRALDAKAKFERWGVLQYVGGKRWVESVTDAAPGEAGAFERYRFVEVARNKDYIEIERPFSPNKLVLRLYQGRGEIGTDRGNMRPWHQGAWEK